MERHRGTTCASLGKIHYISCIFGTAQKNMYLRFLWPRLKGENKSSREKEGFGQCQGVILGLASLQVLWHLVTWFKECLWNWQRICKTTLANEKKLVAEVWWRKKTKSQKQLEERDSACKYESRTPITPLPLLQQKIKNTKYTQAHCKATYMTTTTHTKPPQ